MQKTARCQDKVEVQLDSRQMYFLFFGTAVAACLVFVLGVLVGKRMEASARVGSGPHDPLAALDQLSSVGSAKMTLGDDDSAQASSRRGATRAKQTRSSSAQESHEAGPGPAVRTPAKEGEHVGKGRGALRSALPSKEGPTGASVNAREKKEREGDAHDTGLTFHRVLLDPKARAGADGLAEAPKGKKGGVPGAAQGRERRSSGKGDDGEERETPREGERYVVQLRPVSSQAEAEALVRKLSASGYKPYLVASPGGSRGQGYRVRLGEFPSRRAAETAKAELESREKVNAIVARLR